MTNEPGKIIAEVHQSQELQASSFILDIISEQENLLFGNIFQTEA